jgi:hypothetical protein
LRRQLAQPVRQLAQRLARPTKPTLKPVEIATEAVGPGTPTTDAADATDAATPGQLDTTVVVAPLTISPDIKPFPPTPSNEILRQLKITPMIRICILRSP